jgi:SAM-dependent methyltransferase
MEFRLEEVKCLCGYNDADTLVIIHFRGKKEARIVQCKNCGLQYMSPRPGKEFLDWMYKEEYYASVIEDRNTWTEKTLELESKREKVHLNRLIPIMKMRNSYGYKKLLDIGTGAGYFLKLAKDRGFDVLGIEVSERAAEFARENYDIPVLNIGIMEEAGFEDRSFDVVALCHVIEHMPYPDVTLMEINRILRDKGLLLVVTPNRRTVTTFLSRLNRMLGNPVKPLEDPYAIRKFKDDYCHLYPRRSDEEGYRLYLLHNLYHLYFFDPKALKGLLSRCNFSIVSYPAGGYDYGATGIRRLFSNQPVNLIARIFNHQTEIMFYARKT